MESFESIFQQIKLKENKLISLKEEYNMLSDFFKDLEDKEGLNSKSYYIEIKKNKEKLFFDIQEQESLIKNMSGEVKNYRNTIGNSISQDMQLINDEFKRYNENKSLSNILSVIKEIKDMIGDVEKNAKEMELINKYFEENEISFKEEKSQGDHEFSFVLKKELEFSKYTLNNKQGFSLKNFINDFKKEIIIVYQHYNEDLDKTIDYLQKVHGLCPGSKIERHTFKNTCPDVFGTRVTNFNVYWNNHLIKGTSKKDIFIEVIKKVGIDKVHEKLSHLYNASFTISRFEIKNGYGTTYKILCGNDLYYIKLHANSNQYKDLLEKIKLLLNPSSLVLDF